MFLLEEKKWPDGEVRGEAGLGGGQGQAAHEHLPLRAAAGQLRVHCGTGRRLGCGAGVASSPRNKNGRIGIEEDALPPASGTINYNDEEGSFPLETMKAYCLVTMTIDSTCLLAAGAAWGAGNRNQFL